MNQTNSTLNYLRMIYLIHVFIIALPLLYYGIRGQLYGKLEPFAYTYITLLGGMALIYHGFWFLYSLFYKTDVSISDRNYLRSIYLLHVFVFALPLLFYGIQGQLHGKLQPFAYTYITLLGGMALVFHGYWFIYSLASGKVL